MFASRVSADAGDVFYAEVREGRFRLSLGPGRYQLEATVVYPIEDPEHVDERRKAVGLQPLADYTQLLLKMSPPPPK